MLRNCLFVAGGLLIVSAVVSVAGAGDLPKGGINLNGYRYWNPDSPFNNVAGMGGGWISAPADGSAWDDGRGIPLTADGYPASLLPDQHARTLIYTHNHSRYPTGQYVVSWNGSGTIQLVGGSLVSSGGQQAVYNVANATDLGLLLEIHATSPADPVRDIRVALPGTNPAANNFSPAYMADLQNYGVVRYMDWNSTNNHPVAQWDNRVTPATFHWGSDKGVPYETQIAYSNALGQDLWVTVPHLADDAYVENLARLIAAELDPHLRVWVEYSNEVWNGIFSQHAYARDVLVPRYGGNISPTYAYGRRAAEIFNLFDHELSSSHTVVNVVAGQAANAWQLDQALQGVTAGGGTPGVAAIAPYFALHGDQLDRLYADYQAGTADTDQVVASLEQAIAELGGWIDANKAVADAYHIPLVAYEGGQHLVAATSQQQQDQGFVDLLAEVNRDPQMKDLYRQLLDRWTQAGGSTFVFFSDLGSWGRSGYWGLKETLDDVDSPKFAAVQEFLLAPAGDYDADGDVDLDDYGIWRDHFGSTSSLAADGNRDGVVDLADYTVWRDNYGANSSPSASSAVVVPEPATAWLAPPAALLLRWPGGRGKLP